MEATSCCQNCKYMELDRREPQYLLCNNPSELMPCEDGAILLNVHKDFCCNQWEEKKEG